MSSFVLDVINVLPDSFPRFSRPKLPVSSLFTAEIQWRLGTRKNVIHVVLKYAKTTPKKNEKSSNGKFFLVDSFILP